MSYEINYMIYGNKLIINVIDTETNTLYGWRSTGCLLRKNELLKRLNNPKTEYTFIKESQAVLKVQFNDNKYFIACSLHKHNFPISNKILNEKFDNMIVKFVHNNGICHYQVLDKQDMQFYYG